jgi:hypothetical protein
MPAVSVTEAVAFPAVTGHSISKRLVVAAVTAPERRSQTDADEPAGRAIQEPGAVGWTAAVEQFHEIAVAPIGVFAADEAAV